MGSHQPSSTAQCVQLLETVISCLDRLAEAPDADHAALSLAAIRVQQAIELIDAPAAIDPE